MASTTPPDSQSRRQRKLRDAVFEALREAGITPDSPEFSAEVRRFSRDLGQDPEFKDLTEEYRGLRRPRDARDDLADRIGDEVADSKGTKTFAEVYRALRRADDPQVVKVREYYLAERRRHPVEDIDPDAPVTTRAGARAELTKLANNLMTERGGQFLQALSEIRKRRPDLDRTAFQPLNGQDD